MPLNCRRARKLILEHGGVFIGSGANHDKLRMPWGAMIELPRHRGDYKPGLEDDIRKRVSGKRK